MNVKDKKELEQTSSSLDDYIVYGTELTRMDGTMNDLYGDGSAHKACTSCGCCITCRDCKCKN